MTWSMLVYVEDQNLAHQTQMMVYSKDTASFYIDPSGTSVTLLLLGPFASTLYSGH